MAAASVAIPVCCSVVTVSAARSTSRTRNHTLFSTVAKSAAFIQPPIRNGDAGPKASSRAPGGNWNTASPPATVTDMSALACAAKPVTCILVSASAVSVPSMAVVAVPASGLTVRTFTAMPVISKIPSPTSPVSRSSRRKIWPTVKSVPSSTSMVPAPNAVISPVPSLIIVSKNTLKSAPVISSSNAPYEISIPVSPPASAPTRIRSDIWRSGRISSDTMVFGWKARFGVPVKRSCSRLKGPPGIGAVRCELRKNRRPTRFVSDMAVS